MTVTEASEQGKLVPTSSPCYVTQTTLGLKYKVAKGQDHANTAEQHVSWCYTPVVYAPTPAPAGFYDTVGYVTEWSSHVWRDAAVNVKLFDSNRQHLQSNMGSYKTNM